MSNQPGRRLAAGPRPNMIVISIAYATFAASLTFQPRRWSSTPAYRNLLAIMPQQAWAAAFAVVAGLLAAAVIWHSLRPLSVIALSAGLAITATWCAAFIVRWLTSSSTTPETWVSWAVFGYLLLRALTLLGYEEVKVPSWRGKRGHG